jgi:hypothetical protein
MTSRAPLTEQFPGGPVIAVDQGMTATGDRGPIDAAIDRIQSEYREMPGLRLTLDQMRRLWVLDRQTCQALVEKLVDARFLATTPDGRYVRCDFRRSTRQRQNHQEV